MANLSLREHATGQLQRLCRVAGLPDTDGVPSELLGQLLGTAGESRVPGSSPWPSGISDDTTPIEFSIAFDASGERSVRVLGETVSTCPADCFLTAVGGHLPFVSDRFEQVQDLFLPAQRHGEFALWYSLIFRPRSAPLLKVYFNPQVSGPARAPELVSEGLRRLGIGHAYDKVVAHAVTRQGRDRFSFFALDLSRSPRARVKLYVSHEEAETADVERAASLVPGIDVMQIREFCAILGGGKGPFGRRPLMSSYSFVEGDTDRPSHYSLYLPIRDYVPDDEVARARLLAVMAQYNMDGTQLDRALAAVTSRPLRDGVGLIAHVSLRLGVVGSGITVYLSSEAFGVTPPRRRSVLGLVSSAQ
jgi:DMATS type aromatic prenyltransferase